MSISDLPAINASLNGLATVLLLVGYGLIRKKRKIAHQRVMITAFGVSVVFLACYLTYHFNTQVVTQFQGPASLKPIYLAMLSSHVVLAAAVPVLCSVTLYRAWRADFEKHRRIARITLPIWLYVSVTGVIIYLVLYHLYPTPGND